jgi:hypothetical protein
VPIGMPRLRSDLTDCVVYLYALGPDGKEKIGPKGTGCIIRRNSDERTANFYVVSNWHLTNAPGSPASIIRINTKDGGSRFLTYEPTDWHYVDGGHDVSVVDVSDDLHRTDRYFAIPEEIFITEGVADKYQVAAGDDVLMVGMFADHYGRKRNIPAVRFGNISVVADDESKIEQENNTEQPSHLADMRSRTGFSGSPVFMFRIDAYDIDNRFHWFRTLSSNETFTLESNGPVMPEDHFVGFLGMHCGQFWERVKFRKPHNRSEKKGDPILEGDDLEVQSGMTVIAPAWRVTETIDLECFEVLRQNREAKNAERLSKRPHAESNDDPAVVAEIQPKSDVSNPDHKGDFIRLLNAAAKEKPQAD